MKEYEIYIFDLDGTLTDTAAVWLGIFRDCLRQHGVTPPEDSVLAKHTHNWREMLKLGLEEAELEAFITQAHALANERLPLAPLHVGTQEMLDTLKNAGKRLAIFSTMDRPIFEPAMRTHRLDQLAEAAVAGTDVEHRKPHPAGLLKTLDDLRVRREDFDSVVYIGDKDTDIQAAHNAGVDGVLFYPAAHQVIYDLDELQAHHPVAVIGDWHELTEAVRLEA